MKTKLTKTNLAYALRISGSWLLLIAFAIAFQGCPNSSNSNNKQVAAQFDSTAYKDSINKMNDSIYSLTGETQISIAGATISGDVFYNAIQHIDLLFFVYPKALSKYSITAVSINSGTVTSVSLTPNGSYQNIPSSPSPNQFYARPEKISIVDVNKFISDLLSMDSIDLKNNGANYWVNIVPDPTIQYDSSIGYYFDIYISASPKSNPSIQSTARGRVNPCPPCY